MAAHWSPTSPSSRSETLTTITYRDDNGSRQSNRDLGFDKTAHQVTCPLYNGRVAQPQPTLETHGFQLVDTGKRSEGSGLPQRDDYLDSAMVRAILYPWCEAIVKSVTGAAAVHCFHHLVRGQKSGEGFAGAAHSDYSTVTAYHLFQRTLPSSDSGGKLPFDFSRFQGRFAVLNLWKNIRDDSPIENHHLAFCDATTVVAPDDFVVVDQFNPARHSETQHVLHLSPYHNKLHRWYYFPRMTTDECVVFMQYDSDHRKRCRYTFHQSVCTADAPSDYARESIEIRLAAWFPDPSNNTLPDFTIRPDLRVSAAVAAVRQAISHLPSWDTNGRNWVEKCARLSNFEEIATGMCTHEKAKGNRPEFVDLTDAEVAAVSRHLLATGFREEVLRLTRVTPDLRFDVARVRLACAAVLDATQHIRFWDDKGKQWILSCVTFGNYSAVAVGICEHQRKEGKNPVFSQLSDGDICAVAAQLIADGAFKERLDAACNHSSPGRP